MIGEAESDFPAGEPFRARHVKQSVRLAIQQFPTRPRRDFCRKGAPVFILKECESPSFLQRQKHRFVERTISFPGMAVVQGGANHGMPGVGENEGFGLGFRAAVRDQWGNWRVFPVGRTSAIEYKVGGKKEKRNSFSEVCKLPGDLHIHPASMFRMRFAITDACDRRAMENGSWAVATKSLFHCARIRELKFVSIEREGGPARCGERCGLKKRLTDQAASTGDPDGRVRVDGHSMPEDAGFSVPTWFHQ